MEEGRLTDSFGRHIDFRNVVLIMTSNIGANLIKNSAGLGFTKTGAEAGYDKMRDMIQAEVERHFRPEFLNRVDELIVFNQLSRDDMQRIVRIELAKVASRMTNKNLRLEVGNDVVDHLIEKNFNADFGARPLKRAIERVIEDPLSEQILQGALTGSWLLKVRMQDGQVVFDKEPLAEEPPTAAAGAGTGGGGGAGGDAKKS
jgi:ATP-dependent Clp protease ATP-binding subunit ClpC